MNPRSSEPHYENPPIVEAVIGISIRPLPATALDGLASLWSEIRDDFPIRGDTVSVEGTLAIGIAPDSAIKQTLVGYTYTSKDGKYVLQLRLNGFQLSRLFPYSGWETFSAIARRLWDNYAATISRMGELAVQEVAVRYVNNLSLDGVARIEDAVKLYIEVPPEVPQETRKYYMEYSAPVSDIRGTFTAREFFAHSPVNEDFGLVLDIELQAALEGRDVWELLSEMRTIKNRYFESIVTSDFQRRFS